MTIPTISNLTTSSTFAENTVNAASQSLGMSVTLTNVGSGFDGNVVRLTGILAEDTVSVGNVGIGAGQIGRSGSNVSFEGVVIGTVAGAGTARH